MCVLFFSSFSVFSSHCISQILESISHIHQHDIVHRDLKVSDHTLVVQKSVTEMWHCVVNEDGRHLWRLGIEHTHAHTLTDVTL